MPGPRTQVKWLQRNPNPSGACACSPTSQITDCNPPYCVWTSSESMHVRSPHIVTSMECMKGAMRRKDRNIFEPETVEVPVEREPTVDEAVAVVLKAADALALASAKS